MKITYKVEESDFLEFQLFTISESGELIKKIRIFWISLLIAVPAFGYFMYAKNNEILSDGGFGTVLLVSFGISMLILGLLYPKYLKKQYKKVFQKFVKENYSNIFGDAAELEFSEKGLFSKGQNAEGRMDLSEIEVIDETPNHFFVKLRSGMSVIVPKKELNNPNEIKTEFKRLGLEVEEHLDWEW